VESRGETPAHCAEKTVDRVHFGQTGELP
jgi:hypothetical protein